MMCFSVIQRRMLLSILSTLCITDNCQMMHSANIQGCAGGRRFLTFQRYRFSQDKCRKVISYLVLLFPADILFNSGSMPGTNLKFQAGTIQRCIYDNLAHYPYLLYTKPFK